MDCSFAAELKKKSRLLKHNLLPDWSFLVHARVHLSILHKRYTNGSKYVWSCILLSKYLDQFCFIKHNLKTYLYLYFQIFKQNISLNDSDFINLFYLIVDYIESSVVNPFGVPADVALHSSAPYHRRKGG